MKMLPRSTTPNLLLSPLAGAHCYVLGVRVSQWEIEAPPTGHAANNIGSAYSYVTRAWVGNKMMRITVVSSCRSARTQN